MEKFSIRKLGLLLLLVTLIYESAMSEAETPSLALPSCQDHCGNVSIPYPFGIGKGCYKNEWYRILCNSTRAFLQSVQREVTGITLGDIAPGQILVNSPIISSGCSSRRPEMSSPLNLTGSPFFLSAKNKLTVVGCNTTALMTNIEPEIIGCATTCDRTREKNIGKEAKCSGYTCCQTRIPVNLQAFGARIEGNGGEGCKAVFLSNNTFSPPNSSNPVLLVSEELIPLVLDWYLDEPTDKDAETFSCSTNQFVVPNKNTSYCWCQVRSSGNPYLPGGCIGIDPCSPGNNPCGEDKCVNQGRGFARCETKKSDTILGGLVLGFGLLFLVVGIWLCCRCAKRRKRKKIKRKFFKRNGGLLLEQQLSSTEGNVEKTRVFSSKELEKATDKFSQNRILGQGGQGTVYKGMLVDGKIVAVKKSKVDEENLKDFVNEVVILSQINHRNVVKILGCCLETEVPMLVYEFIPNGNLYDHLHDQSDEFPLTWDVRLRIATEIAGALSYLHSAASIPIYHRDVKTTNILLDEKYRAKVSDFGTSRSISLDQTHLTTLVQGTMGYVDPEYFYTSQFTEKSDVYSFGVVLVELLTGEKPISVFRPEEGRVLATYFVLSLKENKLFNVLDARILEQCDPEEVRAVAELARRCLSTHGKNRPTMREVSMELERIRSRSQDPEAQNQNNEDTEEVYKIDILNPCSSGFTASASQYTTSSFDAEPGFSTSASQHASTSSSFDVEPLVPQRTR